VVLKIKDISGLLYCRFVSVFVRVGVYSKLCLLFLQLEVQHFFKAGVFISKCICRFLCFMVLQIKDILLVCFIADLDSVDLFFVFVLVRVWLYVVYMLYFAA
jgi:hypothetical protein